MLAGVKHAAVIAVLFGQLLDVLDSPFMGLDRSTRRKRRKPPTCGSEARGRSASPHEPDQEEQKDRAKRRTNYLSDDVTASKQAKAR